MVQLLMDLGMPPMEECYCLDILILIRVESLLIERENLDIVSYWVLLGFHGLEESKVHIPRAS